MTVIAKIHMKEDEIHSMRMTHTGGIRSRARLELEVAKLAIVKMFGKASISAEIRDGIVYLPDFHHNGVKMAVILHAPEDGWSVNKTLYDRMVLDNIDVILWSSVRMRKNMSVTSVYGFNTMAEFNMSKESQGNNWRVNLCLPMARIRAYLGEKDNENG